MIKALKYRLYPAKVQALVMESGLDLCRELYNGALQERRDAWMMSKKSVGGFDQMAQLPQIKKDRQEFKNVFSQVLQNVIHRADKSFKNFFRRVKAHQVPGYPRFKSQDRYNSFTYPQSGFSVDDGRLKLSKIGEVKIKLHRPIEGRVKNCTIKRESGKWYAVLVVERKTEPSPYSPKQVGIDVGLTHFATLSDGAVIENPHHLKAAQKYLRRVQRSVARKKRGGQRRRKAILILQRAHAHIKNQRSDFHHKESRKLVNEYGLISVEDLNIKGLAAGMLAKSVNDAGWGSFIEKLVYKAENAGRLLVKVNPRGTSQHCTCGARVSKTLKDRVHDCPECGYSAPRDVVSAQLILGLGLSLQALSGDGPVCLRSPQL